jgi:hypothetical protein
MAGFVPSANALAGNKKDKFTVGQTPGDVDSTDLMNEQLLTQENDQLKREKVYLQKQMQQLTTMHDAEAIKTALALDVRHFSLS